jgi:hypothetical protein
MYTPEHFLKYAKEYIKVDIKEESINQVKIISESKEARQLETLDKAILEYNILAAEMRVERAPFWTPDPFSTPDPFWTPDQCSLNILRYGVENRQ